jgi:hypothetical protein
MVKEPEPQGPVPVPWPYNFKVLSKIFRGFCKKNTLLQNKKNYVFWHKIDKDMPIFLENGMASLRGRGTSLPPQKIKYLVRVLGSTYTK